MLALFCALKEEASALRRQMTVEKAVSWGRRRLYLGKLRGRKALLAQTGTGREGAEAAARLVLGQYPVTALVSIGFAGALDRGLKAGDVIFCSTLRCDDGPENTGVCQSDINLLSAMWQLDKGMPFRRGSSVTTIAPVTAPQAKHRLGQAFQADIVDMEGYWLARVAADHGVPFIAVRAISDTADENLSPFDRFLGADGDWQWWKAIPQLIRSPRRLPRLFGLYRNARQAEKGLAGFLAQLRAEA